MTGIALIVWLLINKRMAVREELQYLTNWLTN